MAEKKAAEKSVGKKNETVQVSRIPMTGATFEEKVQVASRGNSRDDNFRAVELAGTTIQNKDLNDAEFHFSKFTDVVFNAVNLRGAEFYFAEFENVRFVGCSIERGYFCYAKFNGVTFDHCLLDGSEFNMVAGKADFIECSMRRTEFPMASAEMTMTRCANQGSEFNGCLALNLTASESDFQAAEFNDSKIVGKFTKCVFTDAEFNGSDGGEAVFDGCAMRSIETRGASSIEVADNDDDDDDFEL
ncbi:MAG: pentapeptide repeat-containing protein [Lentisphaeria bacterium]|nr:pentapeptide repeat-containing protein [Lentisphaeria bacterium]